MGRLANSPLGTEVIARHFDKTAQQYLVEFRRSLAGLSKAAVIDGFTFMVAGFLALPAEKN
jgi:Tetracyclin repressor-like, C-terminal domain